MEKQKHYNFQLGGGFVYQWWIAESLKHCVNTLDTTLPNTNEIEIYFTSIKKIILDLFGDSVSKNDIDILLEGNGDCFEDINLLYKNPATCKTSLLLIQVKGGNTNLKNSDLNTESVLPMKKRKDLYSNLIKNVNIKLLKEKTKIIIISNKHFNSNLIKFTDGIINENSTIVDSDAFISQLTSQISKNFKVKTQYNKKLSVYISDIYNKGESKKNILGPKLPLDIGCESEKVKINLFIEESKLIREKLIIIPNVKLNLLISELQKHNSDEVLRKSFYNVLKKSVSLEHIKECSTDFDKYKNYDDIFFEKNKYISSFDKIREGKFL